MNRITPDNITFLPEKGVFVFGSNEIGLHGAGAAKLAREVYGARMGQGFGMAAKSFAIPTKDWNIEVLPLPVIEFYIKRFIAFVRRDMGSGWEFYVTRIGCGLAGYKPEEIAPMFAPLRYHRSVWLPQDFVDIIDALSDDIVKEVGKKLEENGHKA
jgi:hypothetical protein